MKKAILILAAMLLIAIPSIQSQTVKLVDYNTVVTDSPFNEDFKSMRFDGNSTLTSMSTKAFAQVVHEVKKHRFVFDLVQNVIYDHAYDPTKYAKIHEWAEITTMGDDRIRHYILDSQYGVYQILVAGDLLVTVIHQRDWNTTRLYSNFANED